MVDDPQDPSSQLCRVDRNEKRTVKLSELNGIQLTDQGFSFTLEISAKELLEDLLQIDLDQLMDLNKWVFDKWELQADSGADWGHLYVAVHFNKQNEATSSTSREETNKEGKQDNRGGNPHEIKAANS